MKKKYICTNKPHTQPLSTLMEAHTLMALFHGQEPCHSVSWQCQMRHQWKVFLCLIWRTVLNSKAMEDAGPSSAVEVSTARETELHSARQTVGQ